MTIQINGTSGISGVDGSAATPALQGTDSNTGISFGTDQVNINTGGTTAVTVDSAGRLLVGTSSSIGNYTSGLQVAGTGNGGTGLLGRFDNNDSGPFFHIVKSRGATVGTNTLVQTNDELGTVNFAGATGSAYLSGARVTALVDGTPSAGSLPTRIVFSTTPSGSASPVERMRISSAGLHNVYGNLGVIYARSATSAGTLERFLIGFHSAATALGGTISINIFTNGNITNSNNSYTGISDIKLKENIVDAKSQWDDIKGLRVVNYNFKPETGAETHKQLGLIAQEVELVSPGLVSESPDRDEDDNDLGTVTKSVNYSVLYMKAVKALQEAMERIETLETRVAQLEGGTN